MKILGVQGKMWSLVDIRKFLIAAWALPTNFLVFGYFHPDYMPDRCARSVKPQKFLFGPPKSSKWAKYAKIAVFELFSSFFTEILSFTCLKWGWIQSKWINFMKFYKNQAVFTVYRWFWGVKWRKLDGFCYFSPINGTNSKGLDMKSWYQVKTPKWEKRQKTTKFFQGKPSKKIFDFLFENSLEL